VRCPQELSGTSLYLEESRMSQGSPEAFHSLLRRAPIALHLRRRRQAALATVAALLSGTSACGEQRLSPEPQVELTRYVTESVAASLSEDGRFILAPPPDEGTMLSAEQATALTTAYIEEFGASLRGALERDRGGAIDTSRLRACGPALYAESPFDALPAEVAGSVRRYVGPQWLVGFCGPAGDLQVSVAVAALATDLRLVDGRVALEGGQVNTFFSMGVPQGWESPVGLTAERAVERAARHLGRRIAAVPILVAPDPGLAYPQGAVWRIDVDRPVRSRGKVSGQARESSSFFAGLHDRVGTQARRAVTEALLRIPAASQPANRTIGVADPVTHERRAIVVSRRASFPLVLEDFDVVGGE
jgi:hypothetical protein